MQINKALCNVCSVDEIESETPLEGDICRRILDEQVGRNEDKQHFNTKGVDEYNRLYLIVSKKYAMVDPQKASKLWGRNVSLKL